MSEEVDPRQHEERPSERLVKPDVSLLIPVYKDERTVRVIVERALEMLAETASDYEIIVVDDGSPDRSGQVGDELAAADRRVRIIHHPKNLGYGAAFKTGFASSRFRWICMIDGDNEYDVFDLSLIH